MKTLLLKCDPTLTWSDVLTKDKYYLVWRIEVNGKLLMVHFIADNGIFYESICTEQFQ